MGTQDTSPLLGITLYSWTGVPFLFINRVSRAKGSERALYITLYGQVEWSCMDAEAVQMQRYHPMFSSPS